jgi:hypothetical protein
LPKSRTLFARPACPWLTIARYGRTILNSGFNLDFDFGFGTGAFSDNPRSKI